MFTDNESQAFTCLVLLIQYFYKSLKKHICQNINIDSRLSGSASKQVVRARGTGISSQYKLYRAILPSKSDPQSSHPMRASRDVDQGHQIVGQYDNRHNASRVHMSITSRAR